MSRKFIVISLLTTCLGTLYFLNDPRTGSELDWYDFLLHEAMYASYYLLFGGYLIFHYLERFRRNLDMLLYGVAYLCQFVFCMLYPVYMYYNLEANDLMVMSLSMGAYFQAVIVFAQSKKDGIKDLKLGELGFFIVCALIFNAVLIYFEFDYTLLILIISAFFCVIIYNLERKISLFLLGGLLILLSNAIFIFDPLDSVNIWLMFIIRTLETLGGIFIIDNLMKNYFKSEKIAIKR